MYVFSEIHKGLPVVWKIGDVNKARRVVDPMGSVEHPPLVKNVDVRLPLIYFRFRSENIN